MAWSGAGYPGVRFRRHSVRKHGVKYDRYFSIYYRLNGRKREEGLGWESEGWTAQKAAIELSKLKEAQKTGEGAQTLREKRNAARAQREAEKRRQDQEARDAITLSEMFNEKYLPDQTTNKTMKNIQNEKGFYKIHVEPVIGHLPLKAISTQHMEQIKKEMAEKGMAAGSTRYALGIVRQVFNFAKRRDLFHGDNPVSAVKQPRADNKRVRFLTVAEADTLVKALHDASPEVRDMAVVSLHAGLRASEIFRLTWGDLDFNHESIFVKDTKTSNNRHVPMTSEVKRILEARQKGKPAAPVFTRPTGGRVHAVPVIFAEVVESLGLNEGVTDPRQKLVFHSLRHSYASWLVQSGVDLYTVAKLLGHKTITMTERYSHLSPDVFKAATGALEKAIKEGRKRLRLVDKESGGKK